MKNTTMFPREEHADVLFQKILNDPWACEKLQETFCNSLALNDDTANSPSASTFANVLFDAYHNRDLSAFLMVICQNTLFDLLRNSYLIPYRFNADGKQNPIIMTDTEGNLLSEYKKTVHEKEYHHFQNVCKEIDSTQNMFLAQAYRYSHAYTSDSMDIKQKNLESCTGVLLIRELPDTIKQKETEAEAYSAVWDLMVKLEKELPMAFVFYGQDTLLEHNEHFDELGIFLPNSVFLNNLKRHITKAEAILYEEER